MLTRAVTVQGEKRGDVFSCAGRAGRARGAGPMWSVNVNEEHRAR